MVLVSLASAAWPATHVFTQSNALSTTGWYRGKVSVRAVRHVLASSTTRCTVRRLKSGGFGIQHITLHVVCSDEIETSPAPRLQSTIFRLKRHCMNLPVLESEPHHLRPGLRAHPPDLMLRTAHAEQNGYRGTTGPGRSICTHGSWPGREHVGGGGFVPLLESRTDRGCCHNSHLERRSSGARAAVVTNGFVERQAQPAHGASGPELSVWGIGTAKEHPEHIQRERRSRRSSGPRSMAEDWRRKGGLRGRSFGEQSRAFLDSETPLSCV